MKFQKYLITEKIKRIKSSKEAIKKFNQAFVDGSAFIGVDYFDKDGERYGSHGYADIKDLKGRDYSIYLTGRGSTERINIEVYDTVFDPKKLKADKPVR